ncbi:unnamed protein product [Blepharisma stoltei]|uniref:BAH domain-containing protein n=1 Tax=Blepharisma stoltei TaxID=1481888 RepID=A0AAU9IVS4_9CILI|nr:unnamed protein product [Blepharisma stoltei]
MNAKPVAKKQSKTISEFKKLKLNGIDFCVGDVVQVKEYSDEDCFATIQRIFKDSAKLEPQLNIRWFYKPSEAFHADHDFISAAELIDSDLIQDINVQCVYGKIKLVTLEEYHSLDEADEDVYFCRAKYITKEDCVIPPLTEWKKACVCNAIINPDVLYISCDNCQELFHPDCVKANIEDPSWFCENCKDKVS